MAEARETAVEMGLIEADDDMPEYFDLDPHRVQSGHTDELLAEALGVEFNKGLIAQMGPHRVGPKILPSFRPGSLVLIRSKKSSSLE